MSNFNLLLINKLSRFLLIEAPLGYRMNPVSGVPHLLKSLISLGIFLCLLGTGACPTEQQGGEGETKSIPSSGVVDDEEGGEGEGESDSLDEDLGGTEAAPPSSGPVEIPGPSALRFPSEITIDIDEVTPTKGSLALSLEKDAATGGVQSIGRGPCTGEACWQIQGSFQLVNFVQGISEEVIDRSKGSLGCLSFADRTVKSVTARACPNSHIAGWEIYIDFPTTLKGRSCSGGLIDPPYCFRVWARASSSVPWQRHAAIRMTRPPDSLSEGAGRLWFRPGAFFAPGHNASAETEFVMSHVWDFRDPAYKELEVFFGGEFKKTLPNLGRAYLRQQGLDNQCPTKFTKGRMLASNTYGGGDPQPSDSKFNSRWNECSDLWSAKYDYRFGMAGFTEPCICAQLSTGTRLPDSLCASIAVCDELFLEPSTSQDSAFPDTSEFPLLPPSTP